jgi:hypothetical protein
MPWRCGEHALDFFLSNWAAGLGLIPWLSGFCHEIFETRRSTDKKIPYLTIGSVDQLMNSAPGQVKSSAGGDFVFPVVSDRGERSFEYIERFFLPFMKMAGRRCAGSDLSARSGSELKLKTE